jgi:hypothetical protein
MPTQSPAHHSTRLHHKPPFLLWFIVNRAFIVHVADQASGMVNYRRFIAIYYGQSEILTPDGTFGLHKLV